jgi:DNA-binding NtrC family response regulator
MATELRTLEIDLGGRRVLVVEDEYFIADEIAGALERYRASVVGPVPDVEGARELVNAEVVDCAVLDINLKGEMVFAFAEELEAKGVPFVFATGYDAPMIPARFGGIPRFEKPLKMDALLTTVAAHCCDP